jgi:hypothetical protein
MMETLVLPLSDKRFVVSNKNKIILVTYNRRSAEMLNNLITKNDYPGSYVLAVEKPSKM